MQALEAVARLAMAITRDEHRRAAEALRALATLVESAPEEARRSRRILTTARLEAVRLATPHVLHVHDGERIIRGLSARFAALARAAGREGP